MNYDYDHNYDLIFFNFVLVFLLLCNIKQFLYSRMLFAYSFKLVCLFDPSAI